MNDVQQKKFGPYHAVAHLDTGGMAEVYLAHNPKDDSLAVVKLLLEKYLDHQELLEMFRQESRIMIHLDHPNVVRVMGTGNDESGRPYIVMEYLNGDHLGVLYRAARKHKQKMSYTLVTRIAIQVANGLAYVHEASDHQGNKLGLVHRDISPQNIFLCYDGRIKILDFGIALVSQRTNVTQAGKLKGKLTYMSPQQIVRQALDGRSDLFSLGIVIWQLLTGKKLFKAESEYKVLKMITEERISTPREKRKDVPKALDAIVMRCLERNPDDRFESAGELREALTRFLFYGQVQGRPNEMPLFAEYVLGPRKKKKEAIVASLSRDKALRERLFGDLEEDLPGVELKHFEQGTPVSYTPAERIAPLEPATQEGAEPRSRHCEWCGAEIGDESGPEPLCEECRRTTREVTLVEDQQEWIVREENFKTSGPLTTRQVVEKFESGEIGAAHMLARQEDKSRFRLISSYPEFRHFFKPRGGEYQEIKKGPRLGPIRGYPSIAGAGILVLLIITGLICWLWPSEKPDPGNPLGDLLTGFCREITDPKGIADQLFADGVQLSLSDQSKGYRKADRLFKTSLLLDRGNPEVIAAWAQNLALMDCNKSDIQSRKVALDVIDFVLKEHGNIDELHRARAMIFYSLGNDELARQSAQEATVLDGKNPQNIMTLGASRLRVDPEDASRKLEEALLKDPDLMLAYRLLAEANSRQGRYNVALNIMMKRLEKCPGEYETMMALAGIYLSVGLIKEARDRYKRIAGLQPDSAEPVVAMARIDYQLEKKPRRALRVLKDYLERLPGQATAEVDLVFTELSIVYRLLGDTASAEKMLARIEAQPALSPARYSQAILALYSGKARKALQLLTDLRMYLPQSSRVLARMADTHASLKAFDKSVSSLESAVELQPDDLEARIMLAAMYLFLDNPTSAFKQIDKLCSFDPFAKAERQAVSEYYDGPNLLNATLARLRETVPNYADRPRAHVLEGVLLFRQGRLTRARTSLRRALDLDPRCFLANLYMGSVELKRNRARRAIPFLEKAHELKPAEKSASKLLARAWLQRRKPDKALKIMKEAVERHPRDAGAWVCLARAFRARKDANNANRAIRRGFEADPEHLPVRRMMYEMGN